MYFTKFSRAITQPISALASFCCLPSVGTAQFITNVSARLRPAGPFGMTLIAVSLQQRVLGRLLLEQDARPVGR